jgi:CBS domain containing-hemolysin-like protein
MVPTIFGLVLIIIGLLALALQRFYSSVPAKELKRLAVRGDHLAAALYRPVAYGNSMRALLWLLFALGLTVGFLLVSSGLVAPLAFVVIGLAMGAVVLLQSLRLTVRSAKLAVQAAPVLNWILTHTHFLFDLLASGINRFRNHVAHSGLYEKEDLVALLQQQKEQLDNRISEHDLELLTRAAHFDDQQAADVVLPMSRVKLVNVDDHIGPVLLGELHDSGQNSFLVYEGTPDHVIGTLFLRDAVQAKEGGHVRALMHPRLCFVHEDFTLRQVLQAFTQTGQFMVVVINAFEEPVGVITLGHLLVQLVGERAPDDFDRYEDRAAVAAYKPLPLEPAVETVPVDEVASPEPTEVVE